MAELTYDDIIKSNFPKNLERAIERAGMSKREFARRIKVSAATVSYWCQGSKTPRPEKIDVICDVLGVTWHQLIHDKSDTVTNLTQEEVDLITWHREKADEKIKKQLRALVGRYMEEKQKVLDQLARIEEKKAELQKQIEELEQQESAISFVGFQKEAKEGMQEVAAEVDKITSEADDLFKAGDQIIATIPDEPLTVAGEPLNLGDINFTLKP